MRMTLRPMVSIALALTAWATSLATFVCDFAIHLYSLFRESMIWTFDYIARPAKRVKPTRAISMAATALNDRHVGGARIRGFLGSPAVRMLTG